MQEPRTSLVRRSDVHLQQLDGEALFFDERYGTVHHLNEFAVSVWNKLDGAKSPRHIADELAEAHSVDQATALTAVEQILRQFTHWQLIDTPISFREARSSATQTAPKDHIADNAHPARTQELRASMGIDNATSEVRNRSRRDLLAGGASMLLFVPPLVSSFIASGAYASGPSFSAAFSTDGNGACKTVGYSCAVNNDCCEDPIKTKCDTDNTCCIQLNEAGCTTLDDCCSPPANSCTAGTCSS